MKLQRLIFFLFAGRQATLQFNQTVSYFKALYAQLKRRQCPPEMVAGIWMLVEDIQSRNYLHGYDIYMHLAVGEIILMSLPLCHLSLCQTE